MMTNRILGFIWAKIKSNFDLIEGLRFFLSALVFLVLVYQLLSFYEEPKRAPVFETLFSPRYPISSHPLEFILFIPCYLSNYQTISDIQLQFCEDTIYRYKDIILGPENVTIYFYHVKPFQELPINVIITPIHKRMFTISPQMTEMMSQHLRVENSVYAANFYLAKIFEAVSTSASYSYNPNPKYVNVDFTKLKRQFFMIIDNHFQHPSSLFTSKLRKRIEFYFKKETEALKTPMPYVISLINACFSDHDPILCRIWDFWRISQISELIQYTCSEVTMNKIIDILDDVIFSGIKVADQKSENLFIPSEVRTKTIGRGLGKISFWNEMMKTENQLILKDHKSFKYSYVSGLMIKNIDVPQLNITFYKPTKISKIYWRFGTDLDFFTDNSFEYDIILNGVIIKSTRFRELLIEINTLVEKIQWATKSKNHIFLLSEFIIIYKG
ncbi:hypothetical protein RF11_07118 [Thelohanellus kitauei]|uniref:Uncharacterized protein n=1 Tax=Thelohanellus kitauei TaxID=669202 RepID=A0A0C2MIT2_THEKT|nr:hypothetical protein RF11_07118 [Thelohanellus kitauei]